MSLVMVHALCAAQLGLALAAQAPPAPTPIHAPPVMEQRPMVVVIDDRRVKDQAPAAFVDAAVEEIARRRGIVTLRMSEGRKRLDARGNRQLTGCGDDVGCLATAAREMGGDVVVMLRLTKREGASFLAITRTSALRPQMSDDAATLSGTDKDALAFVPEGVAELFADAEGPRGLDR
jgi:hypothetical protein